jgi:hypothetical protein
MILTLGGNDTHPSSLPLKLYSAAVILLGIIYLAHIAGSMANSVALITRRGHRFEAKMDLAHTIMSEIKVGRGTEEEVRAYFWRTRDTLEKQEEIV